MQMKPSESELRFENSYQATTHGAAGGWINFRPVNKN